MKISRLIELLQTSNPEMEVFLGDQHDKNSDLCLYLVKTVLDGSLVSCWVLSEKNIEKTIENPQKTYFTDYID